MLKRAVVMLAEGFEEIEAAAPIDILRRAGVEVTAVGIADAAVKGAHGVTFIADVTLDTLSGDFDLLVLPGGMPGSRHLGESAAVRALTGKMLAADKIVAAICAAPVLTLGAWGFLDNRTATCYPGMEQEFPPTVTFSPKRVVVDRNITTSRGPGTAVEFSLALAEQLAGRDTARNLENGMVVK